MEIRASEFDENETKKEQYIALSTIEELLGKIMPNL